MGKESRWHRRIACTGGRSVVGIDIRRNPVLVRFIWRPEGFSEYSEC
jgi:hypothetical protein